ncbi:zinc finger protein OZF-like isoform X1 [Cheilinus undulatus]|uniref:zinc finger protein OZF-like isoform X1 n=1 Tax=Cheilinus undulatus TaxID=241271 RepID=UPI001BD27FD0|nr:zinc finger protein OZF-like isoform X1 [Cheilinus undulatus]
MSSVDIMRAFVSQRLSVAADEIFGLFERTVMEYEEKLRRTKEENQRQQKLLDTILKPQIRLRRADVEQLPGCKEEVPSEQQEGIPGLKHQFTEPAHVKEEQEELSVSQEGLENICTTQFPFTVKIEDDEEIPQISQLHQIQTQEIETGMDEGSFTEVCCGEDQAEVLNPEMGIEPEDFAEAETDVSDGWGETDEIPSGSKSLENREEKGSDNEEKLLLCSECGKTFECQETLMEHMRAHEEEKPFSCSICGKRFKTEVYLSRHMMSHTGKKPYRCSVCGSKFSFKHILTRHKMIHTGEKPFSCSECGKGFKQKSNLTKHMLSHSVEKPFSCSICGKGFKYKFNLAPHMMIHTNERPYSCSECDRSFTQRSLLNAHMSSHAGRRNREKDVSCSQCDKTFVYQSQLKSHMVVHTKEKPYSCSECGIKFTQKGDLTLHMMKHTGNQPYKCSQCDKTFPKKSTLRYHMTSHTGQKPFSCRVCGQAFSRQKQLKSHKCHGVQSTSDSNEMDYVKQEPSGSLEFAEMFTTRDWEQDFEDGIEDA